MFHPWVNVTVLATQCKLLTSLTETLSMLCWWKSGYLLRARSQNLPEGFALQEVCLGERGQRLQGDEWGWGSPCSAQAVLGTYLKKWVPSNMSTPKSGWPGPCHLSSWWHIPTFAPALTLWPNVTSRQGACWKWKTNLIFFFPSALIFGWTVSPPTRHEGERTGMYSWRWRWDLPHHWFRSA